MAGDTSYMRDLGAREVTLPALDWNAFRTMFLANMTLADTPHIEVQGTFESIGIATLADASTMKTSAAPSADAEIVNKKYADDQNNGQDLDFSGDAGTGSVLINSQTLSLAGTALEIETAASGQTITIGLPNDVTIGNDLTVTNDLVIGAPAQNYKFSDRDELLTLQSQTSGENFSLEFMSKDKDGTDSVVNAYYGVGGGADYANRERLLIGWLTGSSEYQIYTEADGTGTLRPLTIYTEGNADQLKLWTTGEVSVASDFTLAAPSQDYTFTDRGASIALQAQNSGVAFGWDYFTQDGDGTDNINVSMWGKGTPSDVNTASERLLTRYNYNGGSPQFEIFPLAKGTGTIRDLVLYTSGNTDQLVLSAAGTIGLTGAVTVNTSLDIGSTVVLVGTIDDDSMATATDTNIATSESIVAYVVAQNNAQDLDFAGDAGTGAVLIDSQTFTLAGTANETETSASGQTITIGLPDDVTIGSDLTVNDTITLGGTTDAQKHLQIAKATVSTTDNYYGIYTTHTKTAGVTTEADDLWGIWNEFTVDDSGSTVGQVGGVFNRATLANGTIGDGNEELRGLLNIARMTGGTVDGNVLAHRASADLNAGTVTGNVTGNYVECDIESGVTSIAGDVYVMQLESKVDKAPVGDVYMLHLLDTSGADYGIYTESTADNYLGGPTHIGTAANYSQFEADGTLEFNGDAVVWDDQQVNLGTIRKGSSAPTEITYKEGIALSFSASQDNLIRFNIQFSHKLKTGTDIEFHVHNTVPDNNTGVVRWILTVSFADITGTFPAPTTFTADQTIVANSLDDHLIFEIDDDIASSSGVSGIALCSLTREGTNAADTYASACYLTALDAHIECDMAGSRGETTK